MNHTENGKTSEQRAAELLKQMTLREKVGQLSQRLYGFRIYERDREVIEFDGEFREEVEKYSGLGAVYGLYRADPWSGRDYGNGLHGSWAVKAYNQMQEYVLEHSRLKIPVLLSTECPHGHQALDGYLLPVNLAMGATFHPELIRRAYQICGEQMKSIGVDLALISMLDVTRDPRWGRTEECFSEDPWLCSRMAEQVVRAVQDADVAVVAKHFAAQGEGTGGVNASAARIGERELREIHLPAMKACCDAGVKGVMAAYNEIDGVYCHINRHLLTDILRAEMGFDGVVMADGCALDRLDTVTGDNALSGALAVKAGVDIGLWDTAFGRLEEAVKRDYISEEEIDRAVLQVLKLKFERGLFEHPYLDEGTEAKVFSYEKYPQSLEIARESVVLLENREACLPLDKGVGQIAVIGPNADDIYNQLGDYSPQVKEEDSVTVLGGIRRRAEEIGIGASVKYARGCGITVGGLEEMKQAVDLAAESDVTVLVLGGSSSRFGRVVFDRNGAAVAGEGVSMDCGEGVDAADVELPAVQKQLLEQVLDAGKKIVVIVMGGRPYAPGIASERADALLYAFYPGIRGGQAIAEILFGDVNPSGRLPVSVPKCSGQIPVYYNYKNSYLGMDYYDQPVGPAYTFGDGMGYSSYEYRDVSLSKEQISLTELETSGVTLCMKVKNVGEQEGYAVPLLYIAGQQGSVVRRVKELKGMKKVLLKRGEEKEIIITLTYESFAVWDMQMRHVTEPGKVKLTLEESCGIVWSGVLEIMRCDK